MPHKEIEIGAIEAEQGWLPLLYSKQQAARALGVCLRTVDGLIATKQLRVRRVGRRVLILHSSLVAFLRHDHPTSGRELRKPEPNEAELVRE